MKNMKKIVALLLATVMVFAMSITVFAEGEEAPTPAPISITINEDGTGHTYSVYQILKGTVNAAGNGLDNITWGANIISTANAAEAFANIDANTKVSVSGKTVTFGTGDAAVSYTLNGAAKYSISENGDGEYTVSDVEPGYYVIIDNKGTIEGNDDAYSAGMVQIVKTITIDPKSGTPSVDKLVQDEVADKDAHADASGWGETADHAINETFQFKLVATIPNDVDMDEYEHYYLKLNDSFSQGVTYDGNIKVYVNGTEIETGYTVSQIAVGTAGPGSFSVEINDLKPMVETLKGAVVEVTYDAHLNEAATIENNGENNKNTVDLEYSNDSDWDGTGTPTTGKTPEDTVFVFTYKVDNKKIDGTTKEALADAEFKLYTDAACTTEVGLIYDATLVAYRPVKGQEEATAMVTPENGQFPIKGLDAGTYYLKETKAPTGYNALTDAIEIKIVATHAENEGGATATTTIDQNASKGLSNEVENFNGTTLPTTGGMGTTMIYIIGAALALGAGVLLIARKRVAR